ncbi:molybdenum cofactor guanylyltransferase [Alteromonas aestuariivivens]|uniref:Molybdenum cofactor guanylyltransferase n=2 Tax=Alteromonas aestuariivivens TaxID=1938339 RepID=A0A3D8MDU2_9ALTE|nr:molybdenum cofactor guanylyltransferase [Alteromonas aestuariivivens]
MRQVKVAGVILAGGHSTRMGQDKTQMLVDGITLLERSRQCMLASSVNEVWIAGPQEGAHPDRRSGMGPAVVILDWLKSPLLNGFDYCVVMPVDMPLVSPQMLNYLIENAIRNKSACYFKHYFLPCVLPLSPTVNEVGEKLLSLENKLSIGRLLNLGPALELDPHPRDLNELINLNHPQDWDHFIGLREA